MSALINGNANGNGNGNGQSRSTKGDGSGLTDRLPPQNIEAEQAVLGAILLDNEVLHDVIPILKVEDFYRDSPTRCSTGQIRDLYDLGKPIDTVIAGRGADRPRGPVQGDRRRARPAQILV